VILTISLGLSQYFLFADGLKLFSFPGSVVLILTKIPLMLLFLNAFF